MKILMVLTSHDKLGITGREEAVCLRKEGGSNVLHAVR
jgi:hypothetical protein